MKKIILATLASTSLFSVNGFAQANKTTTLVDNTRNFLVELGGNVVIAVVAAGILFSLVFAATDFFFKKKDSKEITSNLLRIVAIAFVFVAIRFLLTQSQLETVGKAISNVFSSIVTALTTNI